MDPGKIFVVHAEFTQEQDIVGALLISLLRLFVLEYIKFFCICAEDLLRFFFVFMKLKHSRKPCRKMVVN